VQICSLLRSRGASLAALALVVLAALAPGANAQAPTVDFGAAGESFRDAIIPIVNDVLPIAVVLFAIFVGISLFRKMVKQATKG